MSLGVGQSKRGVGKIVYREGRSSFAKLAEGLVSQRSPRSSSAIVCGSRCAVTSDGEIVCTYMAQSALGVNDFVPVLARSQDGGVTWREEGPLWPHLRERFSLFGSVSASPRSELFFYGIRTPIDMPGELFWSDATHGMKANTVAWARSLDGGRQWTEPTPIDLPTAGSAEAPGPMCITSQGTWHACYSPYNTFNPNLSVPRNQVVLLNSRDEGRSWQHTAMMRFNDPLSTAAEAWVVELADGQLLGTCWNINQRDASDYPNAFALSHDGGLTWSPPRSTEIMGQAAALAPLADGSVLFVYNQRKHGRIGVWLARARPTDHSFNIIANEIVWESSRVPIENGHHQWPQFTFGEPSANVLDDGTILVTFWTLDQGVGAIRYVKLSPCGVPAPHRMRS